MAEDLTLDAVARKLKTLYRLPPMPAIALHILRVTRDPDSSAADLTRLIEQDPSLTAQVLRYARSALFNYPGQLDTVQQAITRVLGFDRVGHLAMGLAASKAFNVCTDGPLGLNAFWRHSLHCAYLSQAIAQAARTDSPVKPGLAYLCGLLHNFGLLLIGHLYPAEFRTLNQLRQDEPTAPLALLEQRVFGDSGRDKFMTVGHGAVGGVLAKLWQLPDEVVKVAGVHQHANYRGEHLAYVTTVQLANGMLKRRGIGDEFDEQDLNSAMAVLGLGDEALERLFETVDDASAELDVLADSLAA